MINNFLKSIHNKKARFSSKDKSGFLVMNKKSSINMGKQRNNMLSSEDVINDFYNSRKINNDVVITKKQYGEVLLKKVSLKCKNQKQKEFVEAIEENEITICIGESGVGKSYISIAKALELLKDHENGYDKIFIVTPIVETEGENIGFLKGTLEDKISNYLYSIYYLIDKIIGEDVRKKLIESKIIEPMCLSYMRGINFDRSVIIADESQNISISGMKTLLTRIGYNCKYIVSGDLRQIDRFKNPNDSGLKYAYEKLKGINGIGFIEFSKDDIVRNPIIGDILDRF